MTVNGERYEREVEARKLLVHFIRDDLDLTGTHVGCDTGNCGACTVLLDGAAVKSCMLLAPQADGAEITTVEGLAGDERRADPAPAGLPRAPRAPVRLLHAGDAAQRDLPPLAHPAADRRGDPPRDPGEHLPLHRLREHRQVDPGGVGPTSTRDRTVETAGRARGRLRLRQERPAQGGPAARPGPGRLRRRRQAARDGLRPLRPRAVRACARSSRSTSPPPRRSRASTGR